MVDNHSVVNRQCTWNNFAYVAVQFVSGFVANYIASYLAIANITIAINTIATIAIAIDHDNQIAILGYS